MLKEYKLPLTAIWQDWSFTLNLKVSFLLTIKVKICKVNLNLLPRLNKASETLSDSF
jgi:hypothetical protein